VSPLFVGLMFFLGFISGHIWGDEIGRAASWLLNKFGFLVIRCFAADVDRHSYLHDILDPEKPSSSLLVVIALWEYFKGLFTGDVKWAGFWWLRKR